MDKAALAWSVSSGACPLAPPHPFVSDFPFAVCVRPGASLFVFLHLSFDLSTGMISVTRKKGVGEGAREGGESGWGERGGRGRRRRVGGGGGMGGRRGVGGRREERGKGGGWWW